MIKKTVLGTLLVGLIGVLVAGAIIYTVDKPENAEARALGQSRGSSEQIGYEVQQTAWNTAVNTQISGRGWNVQGGSGATELNVPLTGGDLSAWEEEALRIALQDEYKAWSVYDQVIADFGAVRPFTSIQKAEENHIAALVALFEGYGLDVPANEWVGNVPTFDTLAEACEAGVQAEIDNAALYDQLLSMVDNPDLVRVFTALQSASQDQHLPAFERCAP
jgi:hypothetical protein